MLRDSSRRSPWLASLRTVPSADRRLVCFPHAGGGAGFFRPWARHLAPGDELLAVQYPGRENRYAEPLVSTAAQIAEAVAPALLAEPARETVLFGHSMGAALAYETLRILEAEGAGHVTRLCVSGRRMSGFPEEPGTDARTDAELLAAMAELGGTQAEVLREPDLRELFLPIIRNDYHLIDTYRPPRSPRPLRADVIALTGDRDPQVTLAQAREWASVTVGGFACHAFPGGHFYLMDHTARVIELITGARPA